MDFQTKDACLEQSQALIEQAKALAGKPDASAEEMTNARKMLDDAKALRGKSALLAELESATAESKAAPVQKPPKSGFNSLGEFYMAVYNAKMRGARDPRLQYKVFGDEGTDFSPTIPNTPMWEGHKDLVENTGASGGFTVAPQFNPNLLYLRPLQQYIRNRAMVIPMRARQITFPVLDQTKTTAGVSNFYGGIVPSWTEEGSYKDESEPAFRQLELICHKVTLYTEASDELLADSAVGLEALLTRLFGEAIANEEEFCFTQGTGAGQPLGVIPAPATIHVNRQAANQIQITDIFNMLSQFMGQSPIWLAHQSTMPQILGLNGPAANPSYVWIGNGRDNMPTTLMGYPIYFTENNPTLGQEGDIVLADFSKYVIGDRQATTIDASQHYRFRYDLTSWRAVHRVAGRPWLSAPLTYRDGLTQVSPFVILDDSVAS